MDKKRKHKKFAAKFFLIIIFLFVAELIISNTILSITKVTIKNKKIPASFDNFKIVQLSDLHSKSFGKDNIRLIRAVKNQNPSIIVLTGDMINSTDTDFTTLYSLAEDLVKICPVYYIVGNHEQMLAVQLRAQMIQNLKDLGVNILDNEKAAIVKGNEKINLYGLWFNLRYYRNLKDDDKDYYLQTQKLRQLEGKPNTKQYNVLLAHNPVYFDTYSKWGADLTLSGHIHGGMIRIPFKGGLFSPEIEFFPKYDAGIYKIGDNTLFVNRGLGNGLIGLRFFNRPEISVITLKTE